MKIVIRLQNHPSTWSTSIEDIPDIVVAVVVVGTVAVEVGLVAEVEQRQVRTHNSPPTDQSDSSWNSEGAIQTRIVAEEVPHSIPEEWVAADRHWRTGFVAVAPVVAAHIPLAEGEVARTYFVDVAPVAAAHIHLGEEEVARTDFVVPVVVVRQSSNCCTVAAHTRQGRVQDLHQTRDPWSYWK